MQPSRLKIAFFSILITLSACFPIQATEPTHYNPSEWRKEPAYIDRAFGKLNFGIWNFFFGWTELATEPHEAIMTDENLLIGIGKGILFGAADTAGGFLNVLTFPITALPIPLPEGGIEQHEF